MKSFLNRTTNIEEENTVATQIEETKDLASIQEEILLLEKQKEELKEKANEGRINKNNEIIKAITTIANKFSGEWKCTISLLNAKLHSQGVPECEIEIQKTKEDLFIDFYKQDKRTNLSNILETKSSYYVITPNAIETTFVQGNHLDDQKTKDIIDCYIAFVDSWSNDIEFYIEKGIRESIENIILHSTKKLEELKKEIEILKQYA